MFAMGTPSLPASESRWPRRFALLMVGLTFPLIWVGGLVTTTKSGMAVPDYPTTFGYNMFLYPLSWWWSGPWDVFVEHGHRLLGIAVGLVSIMLTIAVYKSPAWSRLRKAVVIALVAVTLQGLLGGLRVQLNARLLAMLHGCTGPAFFAFAIVLAMWTSERWRDPLHEMTAKAIRDVEPQLSRIKRLAILTSILVYCQLVLGATVRHMPVMAKPQTMKTFVFFHILVAFVLAGHIALLWLRTHRQRALPMWIRRPARWLAVLVSIQLVIGITTWVTKWNWPMGIGDLSRSTADFTVVQGGMSQSNVVTAHVAIGSLLVGISVLLSARLWRLSSEMLRESQENPADLKDIASSEG